MSDLDLAFTPAVELRRLLQDGVVSPRELVDNTLARIDEVNPQLNCFCAVYPEEARVRAGEAEQALRDRADGRPLLGIPVAIKDLTPTRGKRTTLGSRSYEHWVPDRDAVVVERLLKAGAILIGKTTTPEFAFSSFTESPLWGITRNPWDPALTPGGSSGGSGAAVASGCVPLAEGSDMGGSIRIPASFCGIVGLKPSLGRIPMDLLPSVFDSISHVGPLARSVADAALFLSVTQGPDERDIQSLTSRIEIPEPLPERVRGLRLALSLDLGFYAIDAEVAGNTRAAATALAEDGAAVEEIELGWSRDLVDAWTANWGVFLAAFFGEHLAAWRDRMDPHVVALMEAGFAMRAVDLKRIEVLRSAQWESLRRVFERFDALLCPTMTRAAPPVGRTDADFDLSDAEGRYHGLDMTSVFNFVAQCPALSVPSGCTATGLPSGLQIVTRRFDELTALTIAAALERLRPWRQRRPAI